MQVTTNKQYLAVRSTCVIYVQLLQVCESSQDCRECLERVVAQVEPLHTRGKAADTVRQIVSLVEAEVQEPAGIMCSQ